MAQNACEPADSGLLPPSYIKAAQALVDVQKVQSVAFKSKTLSAPRDHVDADLLDFARAFLKELHKRGFPFYAHTFYRGRAEQEAAYRKGRSKARFGSSPHNFGMAVDIVHYGRYWDLSRREWEIIGLIGKEVARRRNIKIEWGGDWSFWDPAHWELKDWRERASKA